MQPVNLAEKLALLPGHWQPRVVANLNEIQFKVVKLQGDFVWHSHPETDEAFLVISGELTVEFRDRTISIKPGELFVIPKGEEHITRAEQECCALLIEPAGVVNTGQTESELTAPVDAWI